MNIPSYFNKVLSLTLAATLYASPHLVAGSDASNSSKASDSLSYPNEIMTKEQIQAIRDYNGGKLDLKGIANNPDILSTVVPGRGDDRLTIVKCIVDSGFCSAMLKKEQNELVHAPVGAEVERFAIYLSRDTDCNRLNVIAGKLNRYLNGSAYELSRNADVGWLNLYTPEKPSPSDCNGFEIFRVKRSSETFRSS